MRSLKRVFKGLLLFALLSASAFVLFPGLKYSLYKILPPDIRWDISYAVSDKFLIGMVYFVENNGQLLLVKHSYQDKWGLPGGWVNKNESFKQSAQRELREELGIGLTNIEVLEVHKIPNSRVVDIAIRGELKNRDITLRDGEVAEYRFFSKDALPDDILYTHKPYIKRYLLSDGNRENVVVH